MQSHRLNPSRFSTYHPMPRITARSSPSSLPSSPLSKPHSRGSRQRPSESILATIAGLKGGAGGIDLCQHSGEHPRIGAADVVPFIPLEGATMEDCIALARSLGERVGRELQIPVYLYERAATTPAR